MVFAVKILCHYVYKVKTNVYTNHKNMRQCQWLELVKDYDVDNRYHPRKTDMVVEGLSQKVVLSQVTTFSKLQQDILYEQIKLITRLMMGLDTTK